VFPSDVVFAEHRGAQLQEFAQQRSGVGSADFGSENDELASGVERFVYSLADLEENGRRSCVFVEILDCNWDRWQ
jgi:hypothetical protein